MLAYKAWRESKARFLVMAWTIVALCVGFVLLYKNGGRFADTSRSYVEYIWRIVYKGYLREIFAMLALLLGVGGLKRERDYGTSGFTLALPVSRFRLVSARAFIGIAEVALLAFLPALLIPALSPLEGQVYPWSQAFQFGLLWAAGGAFLFMFGFIASILFGGEYTAAVIAIIAVLGYSVVADLPLVERRLLDVNDMMSGAGMYYFQARTYLFIGPLPWLAMSVIALIVLISVALAGRITQQQDF